MKSKKILILGPRYPIHNDNYGGIVVLFEDFIDYCNSNEISSIIIDTNKSNYRNTFFAYLSILFNFIKNLNKSNHISLHGTAKDYLLIAPIVVLFSNFFKKKITLRKFAGSFYEIYIKSNVINKCLYTYCLKNANYVFFETKYLVEKFSHLNTNTYWWPNSRRIPINTLKTCVEFSRKFVFISQIKKTKGIFELIEAAKAFDKSYTFDIYGPVNDEDFEKIIIDNPNINYKGVLSPSLVSNTLLNYDVLILPTYHDGEGYPGIILESFSVGIPVISTEFGSIPEIVNDGINGVLIPIKNVDALVNAIKLFDNNNYQAFRKNSFNSFEYYESNKIYLSYTNLLNSDI
jgi:glycosyltransferase involved in cell wall biosynthesis